MILAHEIKRIAAELGQEDYQSLVPGQEQKEVEPTEEPSSVKKNQPASYAEARRAPVVVMFKDSKLLNLWKNEIEGQLSDGAYENSRGTEWLWRDTAVVMGPKNIIYIDPGVKKGRSYFEFFKDLWDVVGDRMMEESGITDEKSLKSALWIMTKMCRYPTVGKPEEITSA